MPGKNWMKCWFKFGKKLPKGERIQVDQNPKVDENLVNINNIWEKKCWEGVEKEKQSCKKVEIFLLGQSWEREEEFDCLRKNWPKCKETIENVK